ncbi:MAG: hypothetical protein OEW35_17690 [Gammaproteobacteria bacterium]|nr:hypothetical protein [Gammaproteobacteria bacterium]MDH5311421.1 hypothetical protein [Gammaproteobacteria bacterium]
MFRLAGFVIGSAISIVAIVVMVGTPEFHLDDEPEAAERYEEAIRKLKEKRHTPGQETPQAELPLEPPGPIDAPLAVGPAAPAEEVSAVEPKPVADGPPAGSPESFTVAADETPPPEPAWQAIWNPFRSKVAAEGFVRQLERTTGLDYRVVKLKAGAYQVAFAYSDDAERRDKLERIATVTGLELGDAPR